MLTYTTIENKCEYGSRCRNLHIFLFISSRAQNIFLVRDFTLVNNQYAIYRFCLQYMFSLLGYTATVLVHWYSKSTVNFQCVCTSMYSVIYCFYSLSICIRCRLKDSSLLSSSVVIIQSVSLLSDSVVTIRYRIRLVSYR